MKKLLLAILALALLLLSSCLPDTPPPPYGVWVSEEPRIVLFFKPEYRIIENTSIYFGIYTINDVDTKIFTNFGNGLWLEIFDLTEPRLGRQGLGHRLNHSGRLLSAPYRLIGNEIHYLISPDVQEKLGVEIIVFRHTEDYVPIDPHWIANFVPYPE